MGKFFHRSSGILCSARQEGNSDQFHSAQPGHQCFEADAMANIFIFSVDDTATGAYCGITITEGCELGTLLPSIQDKSQLEDLGRIYPDGKCYPWGVQESGDNFSTWNIMAKDDLVLGYRNRSIVSAAYVLMKIKNPSLAARLWNNSTEGPYSLMCFTDEPHLGDVPIVPQMLRYLDRDCRGFTKLDSEKCDNIIRDYGSYETFIRLGLGYDFPFSLRHSE